MDRLALEQQERGMGVPQIVRPDRGHLAAPLDLPRLGCVLKLPAGWSYSTKTVTYTLKLNSNGLAYVVDDNLFDSYQRIS